VKQAAAGDLERVFVGAFLDLQGDVALQFLEKALAKVSAGDVFALFADERESLTLNIMVSVGGSISVAVSG